jgi:hypothetical protein
MGMSNCIYCNELFDPQRGEGDHVLSAALFGEFEGDVRFRGICTHCNNKLGSNEQLLAQSSQLGFYRHVVQPNLGRRKRGGLRQCGARGGSKPRFTTSHKGFTLLAEVTHENALEGTIPEQLVIRNSDGQWQIRLFPGMSPAALRTKISSLGIADLSTGYLTCDNHNTDEYQKLLGEVLPNFKFTELETVEPGTYQNQGRMSFEFSRAYFQALAKIAFHHYLVRNKRGCIGSEPEFSAIRDFITKGGDQSEFFISAGRKIVTPYSHTTNGRPFLPTQWCHVLAIDETIWEAVIYLQLFLGPKLLARPVYVTVGKVDGRILPNALSAHVFQYQNRTDRFAGSVSEATINVINP